MRTFIKHRFLLINMIEIFLSNKEMSKEKTLNILLDNKILCNVFNLNSIVLNKKANEYQKQKGFKIVLFDDELDNKFFKCFMELRKQLKINCLWINTKSFNGCIMNYKPFIQYEKDVLKLTDLFKCSEY